MVNIGIERSRYDKWLFGVCGGIAHKYEVNPLLIRVTTIVLAIAIPGISIWPIFLLYAILGIMLPQSETF